MYVNTIGIKSLLELISTTEMLSYYYVFDILEATRQVAWTVDS